MPVRRGKSRDPSDSSLRHVKKEKWEQESYEAYLDSLKGSTYSFDQNDKEKEEEDDWKEPKTMWKRENGPKQKHGGDYRPPRRSRSNQQEKDNPPLPEEKIAKRDRPLQKQQEKQHQQPVTPTQLRQTVRKVKKEHGQRQPVTPTLHRQAVRKVKQEREQQQPVTPTQLRRGVRRTRSNSLASSPDPSTPRQRIPRSKSIDVTKMSDNIMAPTKSPQTPGKSPRTPNEKLRRLVRAKSNDLPQTPNSFSPRHRKPVGRSKSIQHNIAVEAEESPNKSVLQRGRNQSKSPMRVGQSRSRSPLRRILNRSRSKSSTGIRTNDTANRDRSGKSAATDANGSGVPEFRRIVEAKISHVEVERIKEIEIRYPANKKQQRDCYDIIVIGMQEATFSTNDENLKQQSIEEDLSSKQQNRQKKEVIKSSRSSDDTDDDSDEDSEGNTADDGSLHSLTEHGDDFPLDRTDDEDDFSGDKFKISKSKKKMTRKKKMGRKSGLLKKISKATSKTAKTIDTFAGGGKDHTARPLLASPPPVAEDEGTDTSTPLVRSETFSSMDTDDYEIPLSHENTSGKGNATSNTKKWSDTDILHHGLESNQIPGYKRALSYQFGQMRLLVYYKLGENTSDLLQSLDVLSVGYQATGKAGLANKGGIVAEVAVNKTTKLSFMTAHLEAHEGMKHYKARNESLQDILVETASSKYFDASLSSHFTFAMGDLNYRTKLADVAVGSDRHTQCSHDIVNRRDWRVLNQYDELITSLSNKLCLSGFKTAYCNFPPTFKVDRQHGYLYNPKRSPSYTDRVLFKNADKLDSATKLLLYEPVEGFTSSDHKPIRSGFSIRLNRELRWKSTAELLLEAGKRNKSPDDLNGIIPSVSKGNIDADRETINFFVTNIECLINPSNYDQIRKQEKADLPNPKVYFIANPSEAVALHEDSGKKRRFGLGSRSKSSRENSGGNPGEGAKKKENKIPSTPTSKNTMHPIWKDDHIYFGMQTHTEHGRPIDFAGAQLHISLVDAKNGNSVIGSHCLNLADIIIRSREKASKNSERSMPSGIEQKRLHRVCSKQRLGSDKQGSQRRLSVNSASEKSKIQKRGGPNPNPVSGYQLIHKPSPVMRAAAASSMKFGSSIESNKSLPPAVKKAAEAIHRAESGASNLYESIMADLGGAMKPRSKTNRSNEFGFRSLRLQETLIGGGLVTGQIKCDIDVWWT